MMSNTPKHTTDAIPDELILAAIDRAERHRGAAVAGVPIWEIARHLSIGRRSGAARRVRSRLAALEEEGSLARSRHRGVEIWTPTRAAHHRLRRADGAGGVPALPESPQHRAWREAQVLASQELDRMRASVRATLAEAVLLLDARPAVSSDAWFELSERAQRGLWRLGSASYCIYEWAEPADEQADIDDHCDPGDEGLSKTECRRRRLRRIGRRNTTLWRDREPC